MQYSSIIDNDSVDAFTLSDTAHLLIPLPQKVQLRQGPPASLELRPSTAGSWRGKKSHSLYGTVFNEWILIIKCHK